VFWQRYRPIAVDQEPAPDSPWLDEKFVERYARWREESAAVRSAYEQWRSAEGRNRALSWSAYQAALDREEQAAHAYRECAEQIADRKG
jgi:hypothetical protein